MGALTEHTPKPMLVVSGKNLIEHKLAALPAGVDSVILVVGYLGEVIKDFFGERFAGKQISYVEQKNIVGGTADALWSAKDMLHDRFIVMMGDDMYSKDDIASCLAQAEWCQLVQRMNDIRSGGKISLDADGTIVDVVEGGDGRGEGYMGTNLFVLDERIFLQEPVPKAPGSSELGLPQTVLAAARAQGVRFSAVPATSWIQITAPEDIPAAEAQLSHPASS
jgi:bifunctional UDP-N-acetylglucosamine pyrophosphorylase/glucosamine-1-phosphate N-acetyltransferase